MEEGIGRPGSTGVRREDVIERKGSARKHQCVCGTAACFLYCLRLVLNTSSSISLYNGMI